MSESSISFEELEQIESIETSETDIVIDDTSLDVKVKTQVEIDLLET